MDSSGEPEATELIRLMDWREVLMGLKEADEVLEVADTHSFLNWGVLAKSRPTLVIL